MVQIGDEIMVQILDIDEDRRRISLGIKQTMPNPWEEFDKNHQKVTKYLVLSNQSLTSVSLSV